ncbi:MAG: hypothetical protein JJE01_14165 [Gemmatimonadetes bacterium]|nr:hypothetical protein [Gemmatimonadota bacterium]
MFAHDGTHRRMLAAVLAFAAPAFLLTACNDDPLLEIPCDAPTADAGVDQTVIDADDSGDEVVLLDGSASTAAGADAIATYAWTEGGVDIVGAAVDGGRTLSAGFDVGVHNVSLTVTTVSGCTDTDEVVITVEALAGNADPTATITEPADGAVFFDTEMITFTGSGNDTEDGALTGTSLVWTSDVDDEIGTGETFMVNAADLTLGVHEITLTATDTEAATGTMTAQITINEATSLISFATDIQPYFEAGASNCVACHSGVAPAAGVSLDSYDGIVFGMNPTDVPLVVIGDASMGALIPKLEAVHNDGADDQVFVDNFLTDWINDGAPNN